LRMPHEEAALAFCPKFCGLEKVFWGLDNGWDYPFCELNGTVEVGQLILQENYFIKEGLPISGNLVQDAMNKYIRNVKICGLLNPDWLTRPDYLYDRFTEIISVTPTEETVQFFIRRTCPVFLMLKFAKDVLGQEMNFEQFKMWFYDTFRNELPPWHAPPEEEIALWQRIEAILGHLRYAETRIEGKNVKEHFRGVVTPFTEWRALKHLIYGEIATRFPNWRRVLR